MLRQSRYVHATISGLIEPGTSASVPKKSISDTKCASAMTNVPRHRT